MYGPEEQWPHPDEAFREREEAKAHERWAILRFIREQATKGTADYEHKLTKLADAIERGEHETWDD